MNVKNGMGGVEAREVKYRRTAAMADDRTQAVPLNKKGMNVKIDEKTKTEIEKALDAGFLVELMKLRDGTLKAKTVKKKEIPIPTAR